MQVIEEEALGNNVETDDEDDVDDEVFLHTIRSSQQKATELTSSINGVPVTVKVDTGAAVSIISEDTWNEKFPNTKRKVSDVLLKTYSGERLSVGGQAVVTEPFLHATGCLRFV